MNEQTVLKSLDGTVTGTSNSSQSGHLSNGNEEVLQIFQSSRIGASPSDAVSCHTQDLNSIWSIDETLIGTPTPVRVDLGVMTMKGYFTFPKALHTHTRTGTRIQTRTHTNIYNYQPRWMREQVSIQNLTSSWLVVMQRLKTLSALLFTHSWRENSGIHTFPKGIKNMWNANSLDQDLNPDPCLHFQRR